MKQLTDHQHLDTLDQESQSQIVFLMKHSTRCGISHHALEKVMNFVSAETNAVVYFLDLLTYRSISNTIADRYGIPHQSPQLIAVRNGVAIKHTSHFGIDESWLAEFM